MNKTTTMVLFPLLVTLIITPRIVNAQENVNFSNRIDMGIVNIPDLWEASGLVASRQNENVLWAHNDRNNDNRIFAFNPKGEHLGDYWIDGATNQDWEDMAIGPGPEVGIDYIYIGDVGDNDAIHDTIFIYRIPEPIVSFNQVQADVVLTDFEKISMKYPDGKRDSETILLDPITKDIYVVSKREFDDIRIYRAQFPQSTNEVITLEKVSTLKFWMVVSGDIAHDGSEILLKTIWNVYYWKRQTGQSISSALENDPIVLPYIEETQGEAICWSAKNNGYYTLSEGRGWGYQAHLYYYSRKSNKSIVINEIMPNPQQVNDEVGGWFELLNNSNDTIDIGGYTISDSGIDNHTIQQSLLIGPGDYLVIGQSDDQDINGGVMTDYIYSNFNLNDTEDEIVIISNTGDTLDTVLYNESLHFPIQEGVSISLLDPNMDNTFGMNWRQSEYIYGAGDYGTPGLSNFDHVNEVTINEIQYTEQSHGKSPLRDQIVTTTGVLMAEPFGYFPSQFYIQESNGLWSGVLVKKDFISAKKGDQIKITGTVIEGNDVTAIIEISNFEIIEENVFGIDPVIVSTGEITNGGNNAEAYESVQVRVTGICENSNEGWRMWSINDGTGPTLIYNPYYDFTPVIGDTYTVTGQQYLKNGNFCILVFNNSDVVLDIYDNTSEPKSFKLHHNYPNPFNPITNINFVIPSDEYVTIDIFNIQGQHIERLIDEKKIAGTHKISYQPQNLTSGIYLVRMIAGNFWGTKKMLFLK